MIRTYLHLADGTELGDRVAVLDCPRVNKGDTVWVDGELYGVVWSELHARGLETRQLVGVQSLESPIAVVPDDLWSAA